MTKKPRKRWKNVAEAKKSFCYKSIEEILANPKWYPCTECQATGYVYSSDESPDPIEGHKMAGRIKCPRCNGTKEITRKEFMQMYKKQMERDKAELEKYEKDKEKLNQLLKNLSKEDLYLLHRSWSGDLS